MFREELFSLERTLKHALTQGNMEGARAAQHKISHAFQNTGMQIRGGNIPQYITDARLSSNIIRQVAGTDESSLSTKIEDEDFIRLKNYVGDLFSVDLINTALLRVPEGLLAQWSTAEVAEATAVSCGVDEHLIMLPQSGFQSLDLLAHELGHAAEFTIRRKLGVDWGLVNRPIISETTAHYAQFKYLQTHGTANQRQGALGAFLFPYLATQYVFSRDTGAQSIRSMLHSERFSAFREAQCYTLDQLESLLRPLENRSVTEIYFSPVEMRFSIPLALKLINQPEAMNRLAIANIQEPLDNVLREIDLNPEEVLDFTSLDSLFTSFIAGHQS